MRRTSYQKVIPAHVVVGVDQEHSGSRDDRLDEEEVADRAWQARRPGDLTRQGSRLIWVFDAALRLPSESGKWIAVGVPTVAPREAVTELGDSATGVVAR